MSATTSNDARDDIRAFLDRHQRKDLLRFITCGSVDDGKSSLIGRLLHDSKAIYDDQLHAIAQDSARYGTTADGVDLALLVDGLQSEREQGITIDVAYRYFSTDKRKFIIADTPGHEQYTRNMATGASTADAAVILIDARKGVQLQTRRHSFIVNLLGIRHVIVAVNKMDLVDYSAAVFENIRAEYHALALTLEFRDVRFVPLCALRGDNVVATSAAMPWYHGAPLLALLENLAVEDDGRDGPDALRFPVQYVNRPHQDFRGYCGTLAAGEVRVGDEVIVLPSRRRSRVAAIVDGAGRRQDRAFRDQSTTLLLEHDVDVCRGDVIAHVDAPPKIGKTLRAQVIWMHDRPLHAGARYRIKIATRTVFGSVTHIEHRIDMATLEPRRSNALELNDIGVCRFTLEEPVAFDPYAQSRTLGGMILIDTMTNETVGAAMIIEGINDNEEGQIDRMAAFEAEMKALVRKYFAT